jgi:hypothetical protein
MRRNTVVALCLVSVFACAAQAQNTIEAVHVAAGTILTFHLQTRLKPNSDDQMDVLPRGTILRVKMLDSIDSGVDHDGAEFRGVVVSSVVSGNELIVHPDAEVRGLLALLRSKTHPEGFRYELLVTQVTDQGKSCYLTASLHESFFESGSQPISATNAATK